MLEFIVYLLILGMDFSRNGLSLWMNGKFDGKGGSFTHFTLYTDLPSMTLNNAVGGGKTQPGSLSYILRGEEGIEDSGEVFFRNAFTRIGEFHKDRFLIRGHGRW